jgi:hypothetical protein
LLEDGFYICTYDEEGNCISKVGRGVTTIYDWDHRNRLISVMIDDGMDIVMINYTYDVFDQLIGRGESLNFGGATSEYFVYDGQQIVLTFGDGGDLAARNLWGPQVDQLLFQEQVTTTASPGTLYTAIADYLQSVRDVVNTSGTSVGHISYESFGNRLSESGTTLPFGYTGKFFDGSTGLQYNWHRWFCRL